MNQKGQMVLGLPILIGLLVIAWSMMDYLAVPLMVLRDTSDQGRRFDHTNRIVNRLRHAVARGNLFCDYDFSLMRRLNLQVRDQKVFSGPESLSPCFLSEKESQFYSDAKATVERIPEDEDATQRSTVVNVTASLQPKLGVGLVPSRTTLNRPLRLSIASLTRFVLILRSSDPETIDLDSGASVKVFGTTLHSNKTPLVFERFLKPRIGAAKIYFEEPFLTRSSYLRTDGSWVRWDISIIRRHFRQGIQTSFFADVQKMPFEDNVSTWNQPLDYRWVYDGGGFPLPPPNGSNKYSVDGTAGKSSDLNRANVAVFPDPNPGTRVLQQLKDTCQISGPLNYGSIKPLILLRKNDDIRLNMTGSDDKSFCGMIIANTLTINLDGPAVLVGHFNVDKLRVTGNGVLRIYNPIQLAMADTFALKGIDTQDIARELLSLSASTAHNFFVPVFVDSNAIANPQFRPQNIADAHFDSCGSFKCWKGQIESPDFKVLYGLGGWQINTKFFVESML